MGLLYSNLLNVEALVRALRNFPGLDDYGPEMLFLTSNIDNQALYQLQSEAYMNGMKDETPSDINIITVFKEKSENYDVMEQYLSGAKSFYNKLLADKELMDKEPFLKAFVGTIKTFIDRGISDKLEKDDIYADSITGLAMVFMNQFENLPTETEMLQMTDKDKKIAEDIMGFFNAFSAYNNLPGLADKAMSKNPETFNDADYKEKTLKSLNRLKKATEKLTKIPREDLKQFLIKTNNEKSVDSVLRDIYENKKTGIEKTIKDMEKRAGALQKGFTNEEARFLERLSFQIKSIIKGAASTGGNIEDLPEGYKEIATEIKDLGESCAKKLEEGFANPDEKRAFFKEICMTIKDYERKFESQKPVDTNTLSEQTKTALTSIAQQFRDKTKDINGAMSQAAQMADDMLNYEKTEELDFRVKFASFYRLMANTGEGAAFHKNSKNYTNLLNEVRNLSVMFTKDSLNEMQKKAMGESFRKISEAAGKYLNDKNIGPKATDFGEDRFTAALGILNMVDPEKAEKIRQAASEKRSLEVTFSGIEARMRSKIGTRIVQNKAPEPEKSEPEVVDHNDYINVTDGWFKKIKKVDFKMLGAGSKEFDRIVEELEELKYANIDFKNPDGGPDLVHLKYAHDRELSLIAKLRDYLDHKSEQFSKDPKRRDDPSNQKREQPRIKAVMEILEDVMSANYEKKAIISEIYQDQYRTELENNLAAEDHLRDNNGMGGKDYIVSVYKSLNMIRNLDGQKWKMGENESANEYIKRLESMADEKTYDVSIDQVKNDKSNPARPVAKEANDLFRKDGSKYLNFTLKQKYLKILDKKGRKYMEGPYRYDPKTTREKIKAEVNKYKERLVAAKPKKEMAAGRK
jgi:hypothetical protein